MSSLDAAEQARLLNNWRAERDSSELYAALARLERDPARRDIYQRLAGAEGRHAAFWEERLRNARQAVPSFRPSLRIRILILLARQFGTRFVVPSVIAREMKERDGYVGQHDAQAAGLHFEEHSHAAALRVGDQSSISSNLRAAVLGANDGLASNFCLMMGVAGAQVSTTIVLLTGVAGLLAGACSMALGEWLSVTNARELALSVLERDIAEKPDPKHRSVASAGDAVDAAAFSFALFALGALVPLLPVVLLPAPLRIAGSIGVTAMAFFLLGLATSLFNGRSALFSGMRQTMFGAAAALVTWLAGRAFAALTGTT